MLPPILLNANDGQARLTDRDARPTRLVRRAADLRTGPVGVPLGEPLHHSIYIDQNGRVQPFEVLRFRQVLNEVYVPRQGITEDFVDANRNGIISPFDLLQHRGLLNGVPPPTQPWAGETANNPQP